MLRYENAFTFGAESAHGLAVPERNAKIGGFSRWYPPQGLKALLMMGLSRHG
jgi:hypothetical protein